MKENSVQDFNLGQSIQDENWEKKMKKQREDNEANLNNSVNNINNTINQQVNNLSNSLNMQTTRNQRNFEQINRNITQITQNFDEQGGTLRSLLETMNNLVKAIGDLQKENRKLNKENKIFKSAFWLYISLIEDYHPILTSDFLKIVTGGSGRNNETLIRAIKDKWGYFPGDFNRNSVSEYDGYRDSDV